MTVTGLDWDFTLLEALIQDRGDQVILETAVACPCRSEDTYASLMTRQGRAPRTRRLDCKTCSDTGWLYRNARAVLGLVTGINSGNRSLIESGRAEPGDCSFSPSLQAGIISDFDKVTFTYPCPIDDGQQIMRNAANLEDNRGLKTGVPTDCDRLWYIPSSAIWCEDSNGVLYNQDQDFVFQDRFIKWVGNRPDDGTFYTLKYMGYLEWICYTTPMTRFDVSRSLGQRVGLRKKHVAFINDQNDTPAQNQAAEISFTTRGKI